MSITGYYEEAMTQNQQFALAVLDKLLVAVPAIIAAYFAAKGAMQGKANAQAIAQNTNQQAQIQSQVADVHSATVPGGTQK